MNFSMMSVIDDGGIDPNIAALQTTDMAPSEMLSWGSMTPTLIRRFLVSSAVHHQDVIQVIRQSAFLALGQLVVLNRKLFGADVSATQRLHHVENAVNLINHVVVGVLTPSAAKRLFCLTTQVVLSNTELLNLFGSHVWRHIFNQYILHQFGRNDFGNVWLHCPVIFSIWSFEGNNRRNNDGLFLLLGVDNSFSCRPWRWPSSR